MLSLVRMYRRGVMVPRSLVFSSKWRVRGFYVLFIFVMVFSCSVFYNLVIRAILDDPLQRTWRFYAFLFQEQPVCFIFFILGCWLLICSLVAALFVITSVSMWSELQLNFIWCCEKIFLYFKFLHDNPGHRRHHEGSIIKTYSLELSEYRWFFIEFFLLEYHGIDKIRDKK